MNVEALAAEASEIIKEYPHFLMYEHGHEIAPGWFGIYNETTGQSKRVLLHMASGYIFKTDYYGPSTANSRKYLGSVLFDGVEYPVRLPEFHVFERDTERGGAYICVQEFITGTSCSCDYNTCQHTRRLSEETRCNDTHRGNWKIFNGEVVLFDFEGTPGL